MKLIRAFDELFTNFSPHFKSAVTFQRARALAYSHLVTYGRHTLTRLICSKNEQQNDWSADYKFFSLREWDAAHLFDEILRECDKHSYWQDDAILVAMDDTNRKKTGKKIPGVSTLRDPMSLPFHVNLRSGLRYLQASSIITPGDQIEFNRAIPIYFKEAAPAKKPKKNASDEVKEQYENERKNKRISVQGHQAALNIRKMVDKLPHGNKRLLFISVDGSFCNRNFLRDLPEGIISIARARKDLKLFKPAINPSHKGKGRKRIYGERLPTPEEFRKDDSFPWQTTQIFAAGKYHELRYKTIAPVLWKKGTASKPCRLIIIAPLRYRISSNSKLLYKKPAYILVNDITTPVEQILQFYFLRWDIEVNHRDEKSLLGVGDAQMRAPKSVERNPQFAVAIYSLLVLSSITAYGHERTEDYLPLPKWRKPTKRRPSTLDILSQFRREVMVAQLQMDLNHNVKKRQYKKAHPDIKSKKSNFICYDKEQRSILKLPINIISALIYADS